MNRSALVIKMLQILYGRNTPISKAKLASELETNPRNIAEFKKELEIAGYTIESTTGKYGGYRLRDDSIFPSLNLDQSEKEAVNEALTFMESQHHFIAYESFRSAMNKLKARIQNQHESSETIYLSDARIKPSEKENQMIALLTRAKEQKLLVTLQYCSAMDADFKERMLQPYEIIVNSEGIYVHAYDVTAGKKKDYKFFKIVETRMKNIRILPQKFIRSSEYRFSNYCGKQSLMKDLYEVELEISGVNGRLINESRIENLLDKKYENQVLYIRFMMEGQMQVKKFILSLGRDCKVISPQSLKEEIKEELQAVLAQYQ